MAYYFRKKVKCSKCSANMRGVSERGKRKYYCSTYHNYRTCMRWVVEEVWLLELIYDHYKIEQLKAMESSENVANEDMFNTLSESVEVIWVNPELNEVTIHYKNGTKTIVGSNRVSIWSNE